MESTGSYWIPVKNILRNEREDRAGLCPETEAGARGEDRFSGRKEPGTPAPARIAERKFPSAAQRGRAARFDAAAEKAAEQSFGGEEPNPESTGGGQRKDR